ncbi:MAG: SLOG family protein [Oscillospiraceae bacterium]
MPFEYTIGSSCCFTGHRPEKLPWGDNENDPRCLALKESIYDAVSAVYASGIRHYICGMAKGCDMYFAEAVIELRDELTGITLEAAIPCESQSGGWSDEDRRRYFYIIHQCDTETLVQKEYTPDCMLRRNRYMVDNSSILIAAFDGAPGGTLQTINYALKRGLEVIKLPLK